MKNPTLPKSMMRPCSCCEERGEHRQGCTLEEELPDVWEELRNEWELQGQVFAAGYAKGKDDGWEEGINR